MEKNQRATAKVAPNPKQTISTTDIMVVVQAICMIAPKWMTSRRPAQPMTNHLPRQYLPVSELERSIPAAQAATYLLGHAKLQTEKIARGAPHGVVHGIGEQKRAVRANAHAGDGVGVPGQGHEGLALAQVPHAHLPGQTGPALRGSKQMGNLLGLDNAGEFTDKFNTNLIQRRI